MNQLKDIVRVDQKQDSTMYHQQETTLNKKVYID